MEGKLIGTAQIDEDGVIRPDIDPMFVNRIMPDDWRDSIFFVPNEAKQFRADPDYNIFARITPEPVIYAPELEEETEEQYIVPVREYTEAELGFINE